MKRRERNRIIYWLWLTHIPNIGWTTIDLLIAHFKTPKRVYYATQSELCDAPGIARIRSESITACQDKEHLVAAYRLLTHCEELEIDVITLQDRRYPNKMKNLNKVPRVFYAQGQWEFSKKLVGVVGARRCSRDARECTIRLATKLSDMEYSIVSGLAKGVDSYALTVGLLEFMNPIAVLGNGIDVFYPKEHQDLQDEISYDGLLISEYDPGTKPGRFRFPERNRLIAALSDTIVVIGAGRNSGANSTVDAALEFGRKVIRIMNDEEEDTENE